ncbi:MAG: cupin domain-containing protein [Planctomycetaceae bacterium]
MPSSLSGFYTLTLVIGTVCFGSMAYAQDSTTSDRGKFPTMRPSPGVLVTVLRADKLKGVKSKQTRVATVLEVTIDPNAGSPPHRHPGPVCGYVLEGTFEFQVEGKEKLVLHAGDTFFEPEMILHIIGRNPSSSKKTRVLATIIHPADAKQLVIPEPQTSTNKASEDK